MMYNLEKRKFCQENIATSVHVKPNWFLRATAATAVGFLAIAILSVRLFVRPSVTRVEQSKAVQARITKSLPSAAWKTLVSGIVKLFHKFEGGHFERGCQMRGG